MKLEEKLRSDDKKLTISKSDEDLAVVGQPPGTGIVIETEVGIECKDRVFIPFTQVQELQVMLDYVQGRWGTGKPR